MTDTERLNMLLEQINVADKMTDDVDAHIKKCEEVFELAIKMAPEGQKQILQEAQAQMKRGIVQARKNDGSHEKAVKQMTEIHRKHVSNGNNNNNTGL